MRRNDQRKLINIYTELRPVSSVAMIGSGIIAMFIGDLPLGVAIFLNGIAFGVMSSPPYVVRNRPVPVRRHHNRAI